MSFGNLGLLVSYLKHRWHGRGNYIWNSKNVSLAAYVYVIHKYLMLVFGVCSGQMEH